MIDRDDCVLGIRVGATRVTFAIGPDGKANEVIVENLNVRGEGVFKPLHGDTH
jgi:hypothetical protein